LRPPSMPAVMWSLAAHHHDTVTARSGDAGNWSKGGHPWRLGHHQSTDRRRTGGERPATSRQQPTHDDSKRQGRRHDHSMTAGHNIWRCLRSHGRGHGLHLVLARKTVSAAHRCNRTMTCRSALDTDAAYGRQPLLYSAPSLLESSWWPAVPRIRLLPRRQVQPGRLPRARRRPRPAPAGPSLASSR
jgi:hypothetical protein